MDDDEGVEGAPPEHIGRTEQSRPPPGVARGAVLAVLRIFLVEEGKAGLTPPPHPSPGILFSRSNGPRGEGGGGNGRT